MRICLDPGHGGSNTGAIAPDGTEEKAINLTACSLLMAVLEERGHEVAMTRATDRYVGLRARAEYANGYGAVCFVSIHANANSSAAANGAWVLYDDRTKPEDGVALARDIFLELSKIPGIADADEAEEVYPDGTAWVGDRNQDGEWDDLTVISAAAMPAVLVELGFLTNPEDLNDLQDQETLQRMAVAMADAIETWGARRTGG